MKKITFLIWLLVFTGAIFLIYPKQSALPLNEPSLPALLTLAPSDTSSAIADVPKEPVQDEVVEEAKPMAGCSRLGVFPTRQWAEKVGVILADEKEVVEGEQPRWRIEQASKNKYFLRFESWSLDHLAEKMTTKREKLKSLLAITAIPEQC